MAPGTWSSSRESALHVLSTYLGTVTLVGVGAIQSEIELAAYMRCVEGLLVEP